MAISTYLSIITLNVNGWNPPIKREWQTGKKNKKTKKQEPAICCLQETHLRAKDTYKLKVKRWEKIFHASGQNSYQTKQTLKQRP